MVVVLTYWLSYEYVRDPRRGAGARKRAGSRCCAAPTTCCNLLVPYLEQGQRAHLLGLVGRVCQPAAPEQLHDRRHTVGKWAAFPHPGEFDLDDADACANAGPACTPAMPSRCRRTRRC